MSKEKSGDSNEKISANDPNYQHPITLDFPNRSSEKSPSPDIDHLTVNQMKSIFDENNIKYKKSDNKGKLQKLLEQNYKEINQSTIPVRNPRKTKKERKKSEGTIVIEEEDQTSSNSSCGRKSTDNNAYELAYALAFIYENEKAETIKEKKYSEVINQDVGIEISEHEFDNYMKDLQTRPNREVNSYLENTRKMFKDKIDKKVKKVYIEGKKLKTRKLIDLNKDNDLKEAKADAYVELEDGKIIGVSIKQDKKCTKSNFSVEKMLSEIVNDKMMGKALSDARQTVIKNAGLESEAKKLKLKTTTEEEKKNIRSQLNDLFRPSNENIYWQKVKEEIEKNNQEIANRIVRNLFPRNLGYELFEFDGSDFNRLDYDAELVITLHEKSRYGKTKKGEERNAAKLFYQLKVDGKKYRVEIRFKGDIWSSSAQFLAHYTDSPDSASRGGTKTRKIRRR